MSKTQSNGPVSPTRSLNDAADHDVQAVTVTQLTQFIKLTLEEAPSLRRVWVRGEISNCKRNAASGHIYLGLKDQNAYLGAAFFAGDNRHLDFELSEGQEILAFGDIQVYGKQGKYQLIIRRVRQIGLGEIKLKLDALRQKLFNEGLFEPSRKQKLPYFPDRVGIATSAGGAGLRDIIQVLKVRNPNVKVLIAPCVVQGEAAPDSIVAAINALNDPKHQVDVIIAGRGGGSFEDLLAFSDERVVRTVASSRLPIISAVGHQIDHPICDEAADFAAPTPSVAAEVVAPVLKELSERVASTEDRLLQVLRNRLEQHHNELTSLGARPIWESAHNIIDGRAQWLDEIITDFERAMNMQLRAKENELAFAANLKLHYQRLLAAKSARFLPVRERLLNFSPLSTLKRGFSIARREGDVVSSIKNIQVGEKMEILFQDGRATAKVETVKPGRFEDIVASQNNELELFPGQDL